jgi:hypothetical protein
MLHLSSPLYLLMPLRSSVVFFFLLWAFGAQAQQSSAPYSFEWELVAVDSIPGMATARLYAKLVNPTDFLTSVSGWDEMEGLIETTTSFYQHPDGWATPNNNNPLLFTPLPDLRWDSWVTIGIDVAPNGAAGEIPIGLFPPQTSYWVDEFEAGNDLMMDIDGAWFVTLGSSNGTAGDDLRVLVGQFTTDGTISGYLNLQVFSEGVSSTEFMDDVHTILIPEFDASGLSSVDDPHLVKWQYSAQEGHWLHRVSDEVSQWEVYDLTGRLTERGFVESGIFRSDHTGIVVLKASSGQVVARRWVR